MQKYQLSTCSWVISSEKTLCTSLVWELFGFELLGIRDFASASATIIG
jgi:hypothetical protein